MHQKSQSTRDDYCLRCLQSWPCIEYLKANPDRDIHQKSDARYGVANRHKCLKCQEEWPCTREREDRTRRAKESTNRGPHRVNGVRHYRETCDGEDYCSGCTANEWPCKAVRESRMQVAVFDGIDGHKYSVRSDNMLSLTLETCSLGCIAKYHWIVRTKGAGGVPRRFGGALRSVG